MNIWNKLRALFASTPRSEPPELSPAQRLAFEAGFKDGENNRNDPPTRPENRDAYERGRQEALFMTQPF